MQVKIEEIRVEATFALMVKLACSEACVRLQNFGSTLPNDFRLGFSYHDFGAVKNMACAAMSSSMLNS
jgi:hypothetical protein